MGTSDAAAFAQDWPRPTPEQRAATERAILAAIAAEVRERGDDVVRWPRVRVRLPVELRPFDAEVLTALWDRGRIWAMSVRGSWVVALGDEVDAARADRDAARHSTTAPMAV